MGQPQLLIGWVLDSDQVRGPEPVGQAEKNAVTHLLYASYPLPVLRTTSISPDLVPINVHVPGACWILTGKPSSWVVGGLADWMVGGWEGDRLVFCARACSPYPRKEVKIFLVVPHSPFSLVSTDF